MSSRYDYNPPAPIIPTDNDVLCGRGVNIAAHPGNERFRTLITTRSDAAYCHTYSATEKRAVAEEIVRHINSLDPPGRFLKREGRGHVTRGLNGPWEELSHKEAVKKACQALRDCNRPDRETYALGVAAPEDVQIIAEERARSGISGKEYAAKAAEVIQEETQKQLHEAMSQAGIPDDQIEEQLKRQRLDPTYVIPGFAMTAAGTFQPIGANIPIGGMTSIGPDGLPVMEGGVSVPIDPATLYNQVIPPVILQVPHPMFDIGPIDMEAAREARRIAGYRHPTLDPPAEEGDEDHLEHLREGDDEHLEELHEGEEEHMEHLDEAHEEHAEHLHEGHEMHVDHLHEGNEMHVDHLHEGVEGHVEHLHDGDEEHGEHHHEGEHGHEVQLHEGEEVHFEQMQERIDVHMEQIQGENIHLEHLQGEATHMDQLQHGDIPVEQMKGEDTLVEQIQRDYTHVEHLQGEDTPVEQMQRDDSPVEHLQGEVNHLDQMQRKDTPMEQIKGEDTLVQGDDTPVEQVQEDDTPVEQMQGDGTPVEQVQGDGTPVEQMQGDGTPLEQTQETIEKIAESQAAAVEEAGTVVAGLDSAHHFITNEGVIAQDAAVELKVEEGVGENQEEVIV
eukprot:CCRYP_009091-RA/>CCRYP_009091-RA protein AED:0.14 eAED:0.41 QI:0/0/0/1/0/0/2/181/615